MAAARAVHEEGLANIESLAAEEGNPLERPRQFADLAVRGPATPEALARPQALARTACARALDPGIHGVPVARRTRIVVLM